MQLLMLCKSQLPTSATETVHPLHHIAQGAHQGQAMQGMNLKDIAIKHVTMTDHT
jgi:hypothetical protein